MGLFDRKIKQFPEIIEWARSQDVDQLGKYLLSLSKSELGYSRLQEVPLA